MLPNTKSDYLAQWSTIFFMVRSAVKVSPDEWKKLLTPILKDWEVVGEPSVFTGNYNLVAADDGTYYFSNGPWKNIFYSGSGGLGDKPGAGYIITVKWALRKKDHTIPNAEDGSNFRTNFRNIIYPILWKRNMVAEYISIQNSALLPTKPFNPSVDKGLPPNPPIPAESKPAPKPIPKPKPKPVPTPKPKPVPVIIPDKVKDNRAWIVGLILGFVAAYNM